MAKRIVLDQAKTRGELVTLQSRIAALERMAKEDIKKFKTLYDAGDAKGLRKLYDEIAEKQRKVPGNYWDALFEEKKKLFGAKPLPDFVKEVEARAKAVPKVEAPKAKVEVVLPKMSIKEMGKEIEKKKKEIAEREKRLKEINKRMEEIDKRIKELKSIEAKRAEIIKAEAQKRKAEEQKKKELTEKQRIEAARKKAEKMKAEAQRLKEAKKKAEEKKKPWYQAFWDGIVATAKAIARWIGQNPALNYIIAGIAMAAGLWISFPLLIAGMAWFIVTARSEALYGKAKLA